MKAQTRDRFQHEDDEAEDEQGNNQFED